MFRQKKKIIIFLLVFSLISCCFCFSTSAETIETVYTDFWTLDTVQSKVWIMDTENGGTITDITDSVKFATLSSGKIMGVEFKANENWGADNILYFNFAFDLRSQYSNPGVSSLKFSLYQWNGSRVAYTDIAPNENTGEVYAPWAYRDGNYQINDVWKRDYQETHSQPNSAKNSITYTFNNQNAEYGFRRVVVIAYCTLKQALSNSNYKVYFEFAGLDYRYSTMGEYLNMQIVENQNYNTDKIISNADKNASDIQSNADKNASDIQSNADKNASDIQSNADKNASDIQSNQDKNTQSIIDHQTELQENEKNEANQTGNDGVNQIGSLIPNDTEGLTKAFSNLTKSMIHNNTTCKMNFPGIKIPKLNIRGFEFGNVTLLEEKEIDFEYYFTLIPEIYLKLIRALCTIALVVYCFKEMYSLLSFIFTAKGGGDSE